MTRTRFLPLLLFGFLLLSFAACDDPSGVGVGLIEEGGEPVVRALSPSFFDEISMNDITGQNILTGVGSRVLTGQVNDPMFGDITATGYVDFLSTFDSTGSPTILGAALRLIPNYAYGDTTTAVTLNLSDLIEIWSPDGARADTTLPTGSFVTSVTFTPSDTLVDIPLPEPWVTDRDTTLSSAFFAENFHGFALETVSGNAVVGFNMALSKLRVFTDRDTFDFNMSKSLSGLVRSGAAQLPEGRIAVQDGAGPGVQFNFDFEAADLKDTPLNGAIIRLFADTLTIQNTPANFVRPPLEVLQLVRVTDTEEAFIVAEATLSADGHYRFSEPPLLGITTLRELVQRTFFGEELYDHFELRVPVFENTINVMLLFDETASETAPEALLTLSPSNS